jgi:hypothetical protein
MGWAERPAFPVARGGLGGGHHVLMTTDHIDAGAMTYQVGGIAIVDGERRYVRFIEVSKGSDVLKARIVYDYLRPAEA